jgi:hypothetical protein
MNTITKMILCKSYNNCFHIIIIILLLCLVPQTNICLCDIIWAQRISFSTYQMIKYEHLSSSIMYTSPTYSSMLSPAGFLACSILCVQGWHTNSRKSN